MVLLPSQKITLSVGTQVIGKSCKPIPVMVLGVLVGGKKYPTLKYLFILMIVAGVALFMYKDSAAQKAGSGDGLVGVGELLLLVSLTCDGLTGAVQERMKAEHGTKSGHMMMAMNKWSIGYLLVGLLITGEGVEFISFLQRHPSVLWELASFSVASALGQFFIFMTVSDFGPLPCSIITTTRSYSQKVTDLKKHKSIDINRKFFTVLASVIFFGNSLVTRQWIGTVFVFAGGHQLKISAIVIIKVCQIVPKSFFLFQASSWTGFTGSRRRLTLKRPRIET